MTRAIVTRRHAITATVAALALPTGTLAGNMFPTDAHQPPASIDVAETILADFEAVLIRLSDRDRSSLAAELERLEQIAGSDDPRALAAEWPRQTGPNRVMDLLDREFSDGA